MEKTRWILLAVAVIAPAIVFAQGPPGGNPLLFGGADPDTIGQADSAAQDPTTFVGGLVVNLLDWFAWFIAVIAVVMGLYSGFLFITGGGDPAKLATARKILLWAVVGVAVSVLAFSIVAISRAFVNV